MLWSALAAGTLVLAGATPASAHGIGGAGAGMGAYDFFGLGITHMLTGWDHLAFVAGVLLVAHEPRRAAKLVSLFALGHSLTLITAVLLEWRINPYYVDILIVMSLVVVGTRALLGRPKRWRVFGAVVFAFGLAHGLGLATRFQSARSEP